MNEHAGRFILMTCHFNSIHLFIYLYYFLFRLHLNGNYPNSRPFTDYSDE